MKFITELKANEIFCFGSNLRGIHGAGAAKQAYKNFGAVSGVGIGRTGSCYAIPTKDQNIETLLLSDIRAHVMVFLDYARKHPELRFLMTPIGTGLAGLSPADIAPMFKDAPENVILPEEFLWIIQPKG